jgi:hypothetical protein
MFIVQRATEEIPQYLIINTIFFNYIFAIIGKNGCPNLDGLKCEIICT